MSDSARPVPLRSTLFEAPDSMCRGALARADGRHEIAPARQYHVRHGFFTRHGGVSLGLYASLNVGLGSQDDPARVRENRARVAQWFACAPQHVLTLHQVHSADVVTVSAPFDLQDRPKADALVSATPGLVLAVLAADCGPVLLADRQAGIVGAAHAGWRGALDGVLENTITAMCALGASRQRILAALGPSISVDNYELGPDFIARVKRSGSGNARFFRASPRPGHAMFDLPAFILSRLEKAGVQAEWLGQCTYADSERFFSYRRSTHRGEPDYGRQMSAIAIMES